MPTPYRQKVKRKPAPLGPVLPYLLPLPIIITLLSTASKGPILSFMVTLGCTCLYGLSAYFLHRADYYQHEALRRKWARPTRKPWRLSAAIFTATATTCLAYFISEYTLLSALGVGIIAFAGMVLFYGFDPHYKDRSKGLVGVTSDELIDALDEAEEKIHSIEQSAANIKNIDLRSRLNNVAQSTRGILDIIEADPKDLRRARKFLKVYLDGAQQVAHKYSAGKHLQDNQILESNLSTVLDTIEGVIEEQRIKLLDDDVLELDVQIEVLQTQLKHEGIT
ncbi:MAG: 5-bromo-4-chloroindolyl phosphate hydrolysis protein [Saprospiraceae bacterium]|jgi:5-bromo-4-chloroindolyl phosphate hydrolysis protein